MIILILTVLICFILLARIGDSVGRYGWTNLYIIPLILVLVALTLGVVGYLA